MMCCGPCDCSCLASLCALPSLARHLFYNDYLNAIAGFGWREQHTIVFDHLVAPTAFYISGEEFADWWREINASGVMIGWHNRNSWRGFGRISSKTIDDQAEQRDLQ